jgi:hypothetical protein
MPTTEHKPRFRIGDHVGGKYRSAAWTGRVTGVVKHGTKEATTQYSIKPDRGSRHAGEPPQIRRYGTKIHKVRKAK